jgi:kinetochore protein NDC80
MKRNGSFSNLRDNQMQAPYTGNHGRSQSSSRMSLAPSRPPQPSFTRTSMGGNLADIGRPAAHRASLLGGRASYMPGAVTPLTKAAQSMGANLQRRSSVYSRPSTNVHMAHQSFFNQAPLPAGAPHDKRSLRDRSVQNRLALELEEYLSHNGFSMETHHPLGPNTLKSPTGKDFNLVFQWLYRRIDPAYQFQKSIDNEVPAILKQLRYPYEKSITKSQLAAVGGNNWGNLLGMLHWLMQVAIMMERYSDERYDYACAEEGVDVSGDRIIFRFLSRSYQTWLACPPTEDDNDEEADKLIQPHIDAMAAEFEAGNEQYAEELKVLEAENQALQKQIEELERTAPDFAKQDELYNILKSDIAKFEDYNNTYGAKVKKNEQRNATLQKDIEDWEKQLQEALEEKSQLQQAVDRQGISITDIDRMNGERERLQSGVVAVRERLEEINAKIKDQETEAGEKLLALEGLVRQFNSLCYDVGLREEEYELVVQLSESRFTSSQFGSSQQGKGDQLLDGENGYHPSRILNLDLKGKFKSQVTALRKEINRRRHEAREKDEDNRRLLFELSEAIDDKKHEVEALEHKVRSAEEEFEKTRDVSFFCFQEGKSN